MNRSANAFAAEVRRLRELRRLTVGQLAAKISYTQPYVSMIERGTRLPPSDVVARLDDALAADGALLAIVGEQALRRRLEGAARESTELAQLTRAEPARDAMRDRLFRDVATVAQNYIHQPPMPLLRSLLATRARIQHAMTMEPRPHQERDLCLVAAVAVQLLAQMTNDLAGHTTAAMEHVVAAESLAAASGHRGLQAWVAGTKALIVEWSPAPAGALEILADAIEWAPPGGHRVRLWALRARCAARIGDADMARSAAAYAAAAAEESALSDEVSAFGGAMQFPKSKLACYLSGVFRRIGDHHQAEEWAMEAIERYISGPENLRSYSDEGMARIDAGIARLCRNDVEGAQEVLAPLLKLSTDRRIAPIVREMWTVTETLCGHRHANTPAAKNLTEAITAYTTTGYVRRTACGDALATADHPHTVEARGLACAPATEPSPHRPGP